MILFLALDFCKGVVVMMMLKGFLSGYWVC